MEIRRNLTHSLQPHLSAKEITLLVGARQVGKTTLLKKLADDLRTAGHRVVFFNLDIEADFAHFTSQERLLQKLRLETGTQPAVVFIDEIQRKENAGLFLKGIYDMALPYKLVVSGSGSLELKEKIHESLAGRKRIFELFPVSIMEFIDYKTDYRYSGRLKEWASLEEEKSRYLLLEYLNFGGYPRVVTAGDAVEKERLMQEIFQSYLERDISFLLGLEKTGAFILMIRLLASRIGQVINYSGLSQETGISTPTLKKYLWYTEKTFILSLLPPFFRNPAKELVKSSHTYFNDLGLRNFSLNMMGRLTGFPQMGFLFQNFVYHQLRDRFTGPIDPVKYWRSKDKAEVDFIIEQGLTPLPVEVKCIDMRQPAISSGFRSFLRQYHPAEAWIINLGLSAEVTVDKTIVRFLPWHFFLENPALNA